MTKQGTTQMGLWSRTTQALGKLLAGMVSSSDYRRQAAERTVWTDYPRFPPF